MLNQQSSAETALVSPGWVEARLGISRAKRLSLEEDGTLTPIRLGTNGHRRYNRTQVEDLIPARAADPTQDDGLAASLAEGGDPL